MPVSRNRFLSLPSVPCVLHHASLGCRDFSKKWPVTYFSIPWLKHSVILITGNTHKTNPVALQLIFFLLNYVCFPLQSIFPIFISLRVYTHAYIIGCDLVFFLLPPDLAKDRDLSRTKGKTECKKVLEVGKAELKMEESESNGFLKTLVFYWSLCCGR